MAIFPALITPYSALICLLCLNLRLPGSCSLAWTANTKLCRRNLLQIVASSSLSLAGSGISKARAETVQLDISDADLKDIVKSDLLERQFLVTGNLTPSIYLPTATFTDEIQTYDMLQWQQGTQKLFVGGKSSVRLVGDVEVSPGKVEFRFDEDLMFRIPFRPTVSLSGKVVLERGPSGYITSYREYWDQDVATVLKTAKF